MPAIMDFHVLPDMGRMVGNWSSGARPGCSVIRPGAHQPVRRSTVWWKPPKPTAKSLIRGCAMYSKSCRMRSRWRTMKRFCRGAASQRCHGEPDPCFAVGGDHGSDTLKGFLLCMSRDIAALGFCALGFECTSSAVADCRLVDPVAFVTLFQG